jgi:hypothetical protein
MFPGKGKPDGFEGGNHAGKDKPGNIPYFQARHGEKGVIPDGQFVTGPVTVRLEAPFRRHFSVGKDSAYRMGVSHINRKKHGILIELKELI